MKWSEEYDEAWYNRNGQNTVLDTHLQGPTAAAQYIEKTASVLDPQGRPLYFYNANNKLYLGTRNNHTLIPIKSWKYTIEMTFSVQNAQFQPGPDGRSPVTIGGTGTNFVAKSAKAFQHWTTGTLDGNALPAGVDSKDRGFEQLLYPTQSAFVTTPQNWNRVGRPWTSTETCTIEWQDGWREPKARASGGYRPPT